MSTDDKTPFSYFLSHKAAILVVTLVGPLDMASVDALKRCKAEIEQVSGVKFIVFYFRDVPVITGDSITVLTQIQVSARAKATISICSMKPELREKLVRMATIRPKEVSDNLQTALQSFVSRNT